MALSFNAVKKFFDFEIENAEFELNDYNTVNDWIEDAVEADDGYWFDAENINVYVNIKSKKTGEIVTTQTVSMTPWIANDFDIENSSDWDDDLSKDEKRELCKEILESVLDAEFEREEDDINNLFEEAYEEWSYDEDEIIEAINNEAA